MEHFTTNRSLLNAKFEGYRLDPIVQEEAVVRYDLQYKASQATASGKSPLSFQEVQSRITHNHITLAPEGGRALLFCRIPVPNVCIVKSSSVESPHHEYPSAAFLTPTVVFVSDGHGSIYVLEIKNVSPSEPLGVFELPATSNITPGSLPFRIHNAVTVSPTLAVALLSSRHYEDKSGETSNPKHRAKAGPVKFDIWAVQFPLPLVGSPAERRKLDILWHRRGDEVPIHTAYDQSRSSFILVGGSVYRDAGMLSPPSYDPSSDEIAPIPRRGENLDEKEKSLDKPPPYSWTQTSDSVTVAFPLPSTTSKSSIKVNFSPRTLTLHIQDDGTSSVSLPHHSAKAFWDGISTSSSFWTWDREADHSFGLLVLHLDKQHEGTKWVQVFASAGASALSESSPDDVEVLETLDPSELWHIREALEKYTALSAGSDASGLGLGRGVPSLAEGELDDEVDSSIGRTAYLTWVGGDGSVPPWSSHGHEVPFKLLSTALPGSELSETSLIIKSNLDGAVFSSAPAASPESPPSWTHTSTFSALAFVLASKQDTRFTYHVPSKAVFAFENGIRDRGGNVYIYRAAPTSEKWAKQAVLKVGDGLAGSLLGVGAMKTPQGNIVLLCLTDGELIFIRNVV